VSKQGRLTQKAKTMQNTRRDITQESERGRAVRLRERTGLVFGEQIEIAQPAKKLSRVSQFGAKKTKSKSLLG